MCAFSGFETSFSVFTHQIFNFTEKENSQLFLYLGILALFIQGSFARKTFKNFNSAIIILGLSLCALSFTLLSLANQIWLLLASLILLSFGIAILNTHLPALLSINIPEKYTEKLWATSKVLEA